MNTLNLKITRELKREYTLDMAPSQDASDHQDDITFLVGSYLDVPLEVIGSMVIGSGLVISPTYKWVFFIGVK